MWTYSPIYNTQSFEFVEQEIGPPRHKPRPDVKSDDPWRLPKARHPEDFRVPDRDLGPARPDELCEPWVENEWHVLPLCEDRHKPVREHIRFDIDKIPHTRVMTERPFDRSRIDNHNRIFGQLKEHESVFYHGQRLDNGEDFTKEPLENNLAEWRKESGKVVVKNKTFKYINTATRQGVVDTDRCEGILKDEPARDSGLNLTKRKVPPKIEKKYGSKKYPPLEQPPSTIRNEEVWHERAPDKEFQLRMRENDTDAPFNVDTGGYLPRDPEFGYHAGRQDGTKRGHLSGKLGPAPWRHSAENHMQTLTRKETQKYEETYVSKLDMERYRLPPRNHAREDFLVKDASRVSIGLEERTQRPYQRPARDGIINASTRLQVN